MKGRRKKEGSEQNGWKGDETPNLESCMHRF